MANITLSDGTKVKVDPEDVARLSDRTWHPHSLGNGKVYAAARYYHDRKRRIEYLHRAVIGDDSARVSFENGDPFDCRKANLKVSTKAPKPGDAGATGEAAVIYSLTKNGHAVYVPMAGHCPADLISTKGASRPIRWQVKLRTAGEGQSIKVALRSVQPRRGGYLHTPMDFAVIDAIAVFNPLTEQVFYLAAPEIPAGGKSVSINMAHKPAPNARFIGSELTDPDRVLSQLASHWNMK